MAVPRPSPTVRLGRVIATRKFLLLGNGGKTVELRIGAPRQVKRDAYCPVQLVGVGHEKVRAIYGVDTVQALQLAARFIEPLLLEYGDRLRWEGSPAHQSVNANVSSLFEGAGLAEFLTKFAALCQEYATGRPPAKPPRSRPSKAKRK